MSYREIVITPEGISIPLWIIVTQWVLLAALALLIVALYRQIGYMIHLKEQQQGQGGLVPGSQAPAFQYVPLLDSDDTSPNLFDPVGKWSLLVFAEPACASCQHALQAIERVAPKWPASLRVAVMVTAEPALVASVESFRRARVPLGHVQSEVVLKDYQTSVTPFAYVIDPAGIVRAKGAVPDESALEKLLRQPDVRVESIVPAGSRR